MALSKEELDTLAESLNEEKKLKKDYLDFLASDAVLPESKTNQLELKPKELPGATIRAPKGNEFLTRNAIFTTKNNTQILSPEEQASQRREKFKSILPKVIRETLFGADKGSRPLEPTLEDSFRSSVASGIKQYVNEEGLAGFLAPEITKPKETRMFDIIEGLKDRGIDAKRAEEIAIKEVYNEGDIYLDGEEKVKLNILKNERRAMIVLDSLDLFPAWKALKSGAKVALEQTINEAVNQTTRKGMRDVIERDFVNFKGTSNVDDIVEVIEKTKVLNDGKRLNEIEKAIAESNNSLEIRKEILTRAQRIEYDNGVPVVRTSPDTVASTVRLRKYITDTLQSMREEYRLSNPDIFAKEMRAGSLTREATPDGQIEVFSLGSGLGKIGENVTVSKTLAEAKGVTPKTITVNVDDLVRLPDGTFTIAPKASLAPDVTPAIQGVRREIQGSVASVEKANKQKLYKEKLARESLEKSKRLADEQEATRLAKEDANRIARETARKANAEKVIKETPIAVAKRKADIDVDVAKDIAKIEAKASVAKAALKSAGDNLKAVGKTVKASEKKILTIKKAIAKAKKQGRATARLNQALAKAKADFVAAKKAQRMAQTTAKKANDSIPTDTKVKVAELKSKADVRKAEVVEESMKALAEAKAFIKEITDVNKVVTPSTRNAERLQAKVDKLEGKKAKLIEAYGGIDEVPAEKIKALDDAIAELGEVATPVAKAGVDSTVIVATKTPVKTTEVATAKIKPVKIEGTDVEISTLVKKLTKDIKGAELPPEFNVATHAKQTENAFSHIGKHGIDDTLTMIEKGSFPEGTTKASMVSSLMEAIDAVTDPALKLNYTNRLLAYIPELSEFATRAGQEIEALKILHKDNPIMKIMRIQRLLNSKDNVERAAAEVAKLEKRLSKVDTKSIIKEAIDKSTC